MKHLAAVVVLALAPAAFGDLVTNGDFETPGVGPPFVSYTAVDTTSLTGWTVASGSIDHIGSYWTSASGSQSLDLAGNAPGSITQTLNTVAGQQYRLNFSMAGNVGSGGKNCADSGGR